MTTQSCIIEYCVYYIYVQSVVPSTCVRHCNGQSHEAQTICNLKDECFSRNNLKHYLRLNMSIFVTESGKTGLIAHVSRFDSSPLA